MMDDRKKRDKMESHHIENSPYEVLLPCQEVILVKTSHHFSGQSWVGFRKRPGGAKWLPLLHLWGCHLFRLLHGKIWNVSGVCLYTSTRKGRCRINGEMDKKIRGKYMQD
jgi:hypothetical protein